jgi:hypothetical protein
VRGLLDTPTCPDYQRAALWNALAPQLWRRTTIYLRRTLTRRAGLTARQLKRQLHVNYAKATEQLAAGLDQPIGSAAQTDHLDALSTSSGWCGRAGSAAAGACWPACGCAAGAHLFGVGGHRITNSRRYLTAFQALRAARRAWATRQRAAVALDHHGRILPPVAMVSVASWQYAGRGYKNPTDAWLAASIADHRQACCAIREELDDIA